MLKEKPPIIQYVRRDDDKRPIGVVVATDKEKIGIALCNPKDNWDKELGLEIAVGRAKKVPYEAQIGHLFPYEFEKGANLMHVFNNVRERAEKYFK